mmetsp:Transcript_81558/g.257217  ORF Transcript_81558/g.257217 Transcript_81558/m.257217 type:complete len:318 (+) Transcript_81558:1894-2847(+)
MAGHLLHLHLLVLGELGGADVAPELARLAVVAAALRGALLRRGVPLALDTLEDLSAADLAVVRDHLDLRLHLANTDHQAVELDQRAHTAGVDLADLLRGGRVPRLEAHVEVVLQLRGDAGGGGAGAGPLLLGQLPLPPLKHGVPGQGGAAGVEVLVPLRQLGVAGLVEVPHVPERVCLDVLQHLLQRLLQLHLGDGEGLDDALVRVLDLRAAELLHLVEVHKDSLLPVVGSALESRFVLPLAVLGVRLAIPALVAPDELLANLAVLREPSGRLSGDDQGVLGNALASGVDGHGLEGRFRTGGSQRELTRVGWERGTS